MKNHNAPKEGKNCPLGRKWHAHGGKSGADLKQRRQSGFQAAFPAFSRAADPSHAYVALFHIAHTENFHSEFLFSRSGVRGGSWLLFPTPLKLHLWPQNGFFFLKQDVGLMARQLLHNERKQKLIRDLSKKKKKDYWFCTPRANRLDSEEHTLMFPRLITALWLYCFVH